MSGGFPVQQAPRCYCVHTAGFDKVKKQTMLKSTWTETFRRPHPKYREVPWQSEPHNSKVNNKGYRKTKGMRWGDTECIFATRETDAVTQPGELTPQFQWIEGLSQSRAKLGKLTGSRLKLSFKNSITSGEGKPGLKGEGSIGLIIHFITCMALISCEEFLFHFSECFQALYTGGNFSLVFHPSFLSLWVAPLSSQTHIVPSVHKPWKRQQFCFWSNHKQFP